MRPRAFSAAVSPPTLEGVAAAAVRLEAWGAGAGVGAERRHELALIHDELATNVAKYAAGATELIVRARRLPSGAVLLMLEDDGPRFDPFARPEPATDLPLDQREPGGLGVHLVRRLAARATYRRARGRNRIEVELRR